MATWRVLALLAASGGAATAVACWYDVPDMPDAAGPDATLEAGPETGAGDAASDAPSADALSPCNLSKPFNAPVLVTELETASEDYAARLTHDELTVFFARAPSNDAGVAGGAGNSDLFMATRASKSAAFDPPVALSTLNTSDGEQDPMPSADALTLFFVSNRPGGQGYADFWTATRATSTSAFGNVMHMQSSPAHDGWPYLTSLGFYYSTDYIGSQYDVYGATFTDAGMVLDTVSFTAVNTGNNPEYAPVLSPDGLTAYVAAFRGASIDIYVSVRASTSDAFGGPVIVTELNSPNVDYPNWVSDDGCRLYFDSDRKGSRDIWLATKPP